MLQLINRSKLSQVILLTVGINNVSVENVMIPNYPSPSEVHIKSSDNPGTLSVSGLPVS